MYNNQCFVFPIEENIKFIDNAMENRSIYFQPILLHPFLFYKR